MPAEAHVASRDTCVIKRKDPKICRIMFQNINGISSSNHYVMLHDSVESKQNKEVDLNMLVETNLNHHLKQTQMDWNGAIR